ncbi:hypothetical protein IRJ41_020980 [Triplophysa rosa]|uniref:Uncharacterized protein n=1 Tax=Triplophysa rosa TaxID=992332 RepID=A0A9W8C2W1_TRIRA|nr:hypothetical protein IRJ41_020980 [Triplophysa rosa]
MAAIDTTEYNFPPHHPSQKAVEATASSPLLPRPPLRSCQRLSFSHLLALTVADVIYMNDKHSGWLDWQRNPLAVSLGRKREKGYYGSCFISCWKVALKRRPLAAFIFQLGQSRPARSVSSSHLHFCSRCRAPPALLCDSLWLGLRSGLASSPGSTVLSRGRDDSCRTLPYDLPIAVSQKTTTVPGHEATVHAKKPKILHPYHFHEVDVKRTLDLYCLYAIDRDNILKKITSMIDEDINLVNIP